MIAILKEKEKSFKTTEYENRSIKPGGKGRNDPPQRKFMKLGGKVKFWVLSSKLNVIRAKKGAISLFFTSKNLVIMTKALFSDSTNMSAALQMKNGFNYYI